MQQTSSHSRWQLCPRHHVSEIDRDWTISTCLGPFDYRIFFTLSVITRISLRMRLSSRWTPGGKLPADAGVDEPPPPEGAPTDVPGTPSKSCLTTENHCGPNTVIVFDGYVLSERYEYSILNSGTVSVDDGSHLGVDRRKRR